MDESERAVSPECREAKTRPASPLPAFQEKPIPQGVRGSHRETGLATWHRPQAFRQRLFVWEVQGATTQYVFLNWYFFSCDGDPGKLFSSKLF